MSADFTLGDVVAVACAEAFRGDGEILASPIGAMPSLGARLALATFSPDLLMTDGVARLMSGGVVEGWLPYRAVFDLVWSGRRHVMMGATQLDRFGNQNISAIGDWRHPVAQLLGVRGAPGNTINHPTSYFVPRHSPKVFVERVDAVSGIGYDRAAELGPEASRYHRIPRVVSNLGVFDFETPDHSMRVRSLHPGVSAEQLRAATGFALQLAADVPVTRAPTVDELRLLGELDPSGAARREMRP